MTEPTGYRCLECGTCSVDGGEHADGCGQPERDRARSRERWYEQLASYIPHTAPDRPLVRIRHEDGAEDVAELYLTHPPLVGKATIE